MDWTDEAIDRLRVLWGEGLSTMQIAIKMGTSKNAVVGKAHRLNLSSRPSPIRRDGAAPKRRPSQAACIAHAAEILPRLESLTGPSALSSTLDESPVAPPPRGPLKHRRVNTRNAAIQALFASKPHRAERNSAPVRPADPVAQDLKEASKYTRALGTAVRPCCWPIGEPRTKEFRFCDDTSLPGRPYCETHCRFAYLNFRAPDNDIDTDIANTPGVTLLAEEFDELAA